LAEANGRSQTAEIVAAIERHVTSADRITELWKFFEKHREHIETIPEALAAIENLELTTGAGFLRERRLHKERLAREDALPLVTADEAQTIRRLLKELDINEEKFLKLMRAPRIEEIRGFERAFGKLEAARLYRKENPPE
jgi:hypothetical protein